MNRNRLAVLFICTAVTTSALSAQNLCTSPPTPVTLEILSPSPRPQDDNFRIAGTYGFSVALVPPNEIRLYGTSGNQRRRWNAAGTAVDDLYFSTAGCSLTLDPRDWDPRCLEQIGLFWKYVACGSGIPCEAADRWNAYSGTNNISTFPTFGFWPRTAPADWGVAGYTPVLTRNKVNSTLLNPPSSCVSGHPSQPTSCPPKYGKEEYCNTSNLDAFVTGVANPKVVQVYYGGGVRKWFMAFNTLIQADSGPGSRWRILWAYSDDGKIWTVDPQVLFRSSSEAMSGCGGKGLMVTNLFIDNGNFYMAFTEIGKPYAYLVRSPINTVNRVPGYSTWNIASSPIQANGEWTWKPLTPGIQQDFTSPPLNAASILPSCESSPPFMVKQSYIGRFFQSSTPNSPSRYIAVTSDMVGGQTKLQVWSSASLNKPFQYESDVAISAQDIGQFGLEFAFTQYPDNLPSSPRLLAPQLDFWLVRNIGAGLSQVTVSRRTAKLTGGGIF